MTNRGRRESSTGIYHVVSKGINHEKIFHQQREKIYFKMSVLKYSKKYEVEIYAYCIMSNHFHMLIKTSLQVLSLFMARILAEYASYYNYKHHRNGHVFQNRFKSECVESTAYFWNCLRYIHNNPVKANMVKKAVCYKYSSMGEYFTGERTLLCDKFQEILRIRFQSYDEFEKFHYRRCYDIFTDTKEEIQAQHQEVAMMIAEKMYEEKRLYLLIQVFEEKEIRREYIKAIRSILKVSQRKAEKISTIIKNQIENM